jgi:hypothetical protein
MKIKISAAAYAAAAILAAYASYELAVEVGAAYQFGTVTEVSGGFALFAVMTGALWTTIAQFMALFAIERQYSLSATIVKIIGLVGGIAAASLGMWSILYGADSWKTAAEFVVGFLGVYAFVHVSVFATETTPEPTTGG